MLLAHKIRLKPNKDQESYFIQAAGTARFTYNWALAEWIRQHETGQKPSVFGLKKHFNAIKHEQFPWVANVTKCASEQAFTDVGTAFANFFRGLKNGQKVGYPKFKSKKRTAPSFYVANDQFSLDGRFIRVPKLGRVRMREELRFDGKIMGARITRDGNHWFVAIQVEVDIDVPFNGNEPIGIDLGIKTLMTLSDGTVVENQRYSIKHEKRLRKINKKLSRQVKGSNNWWKTVHKLRSIHAKIRDCRNDYAHKLTSHISKNYGIIGVENLNAAGMIQNHKLAKHIADASFGELVRQLEYKQHIYGSFVQKVDRWFASSKTCSGCGQTQDMPLSVRTYRCESCGLIIDRDLNAAINIKNEAIRLAY